MADGTGYVKLLSKEEWVSGFNNILDFTKKNLDFLWKGNEKSLLSKYINDFSSPYSTKEKEIIIMTTPWEEISKLGVYKSVWNYYFIAHDNLDKNLNVLRDGEVLYSFIDRFKKYKFNTENFVVTSKSNLLLETEKILKFGLESKMEFLKENFK